MHLHKNVENTKLGLALICIDLICGFVIKYIFECQYFIMYFVSTSLYAVLYLDITQLFITFSAIQKNKQM